jgi:hypothetical protein
VSGEGAADHAHAPAGARRKTSVASVGGRGNRSARRLHRAVALRSTHGPKILRCYNPK